MGDDLTTPRLTPTNLYDDGELYDLVMRPQDEAAELEFYDALASGMSTPILELGCGTGRLSLPLALRGHAMSGIDCAEGMLNVARAKAASAGAAINYVQADFCNFRIDGKHGLILLPYNALAHVDTLDGIWGCFSSVRAQLAPGGLFVIDITNPTPCQLGNDMTIRHLLRSVVTDAGKKVDVYQSSTYDLATQIHERALFVQQQGEEARLNFKTRVFFPQELDNLLRLAGFNILRKFGSFGTEPFTSASDKQVIVCSKQPSGLYRLDSEKPGLQV